MIVTGGLGQSGVSTLNAVLSTHPQIATCPLETCFVVTGGGLLDLTHAISDGFSPMRVDDALARFHRLMTHDLCSPRSYPFNRIDLGAIFGRAVYRSAVDAYFNEIRAVRYQGDGLTIESRARLGGWSFPDKVKRFHFPWWMGRERDYLYALERQSREDAICAGRNLILSLQGARADRMGKAVWTDQTTNNLLDADFWLEMFPEAYFLQVVRDPLDIAITQQLQSWAPDDFRQVCLTIRDSYRRWTEVRSSVPQASYIEVRFEDLVSTPASVVNEICNRVGLDRTPAAAHFTFDQSRLGPLYDLRSRVDLDCYRAILGPVAEALGYTVP